jgi:hypothetical protein
MHLRHLWQRVVEAQFGLNPAAMDEDVWALATLCPQLRALTVLEGLVTPDTLGALGSLFPRLTSVATSFTRMADEQVLALAARCPDLQTFIYEFGRGAPLTGRGAPLTGRGAPLTGRGVAWLAARCRQLVRLEVAGSGVTDDALMAVGQHCSALQTLNLKACMGWTDRGLRALLAECRALTKLSFAYTSLDDDAMLVIAERCPKLRVLIVDECGAVSDAGVRAVAARCPGLVELSAVHCALTDVAIADIARHCPLLETLRIESCDFITDVGIEALGRHCTKLRCLELAGCVKLTDRGMANLVGRCPELRILDVSRSRKIGGKTLAAIAANCRHLQTLILDNCTAATQRGLVAVALACPHLAFVSLATCPAVTNESLIAMMRVCLHLREICILGNERPTDALLESMAASWLDEHILVLDTQYCLGMSHAYRSRWELGDLMTLFDGIRERLSSAQAQPVCDFNERAVAGLRS